MQVELSRPWKHILSIRFLLWRMDSDVNATFYLSRNSFCYFPMNSFCIFVSHTTAHKYKNINNISKAVLNILTLKLKFFSNPPRYYTALRFVLGSFTSLLSIIIGTLCFFLIRNTIQKQLQSHLQLLTLIIVWFMQFSPHIFLVLYIVLILFRLQVQLWHYCPFPYIFPICQTSSASFEVPDQTPCRYTL